jgi:hypothetical protein
MSNEPVSHGFQEVSAFEGTDEGTDRVPAADRPSFEHTGKNALARHNAIPCLIVNRAFLVALFSNLGNFDDGAVTEPKAAPDRDALPVNAFGGYVLGKVSKSDIQTSRLAFLYSFCGEETDLPFPRPGVGVTHDSVTDAQFRRFDLGFPGSLLVA